MKRCRLSVGEENKKSTSSSEVLLLWGRVDSNHRTHPRTDLQSVAIATMRLPHQNPTKEFDRAGGGIWTPDPEITNHVLYR